MVDARGNSISIVLVVQDLANISSWALRLVDRTFVHTKMSSVGSDKSFRVDIYEGPVKGPMYPTRRRLRMVVGRYKKEIYSLYKSHTMSEAGVDGANEKTQDSRASILKRWGVMIGIPGGIIGMVIGFHYVGQAMEKAKALPPGAKASSASVAPPAAPQPPTLGSAFVNRAVQVVERPPNFRIVGTVQNIDSPAMSRAVLIQDGGKLPLFVVYSKCRTVDDRLECPVGNWYYSELGIVGTGHEVGEGAPIGAWDGKKVAGDVTSAKSGPTS